MCCVLSTLLLIGPRATILVWWIEQIIRQCKTALRSYYGPRHASAP